MRAFQFLAVFFICHLSTVQAQVEVIKCNVMGTQQEMNQCAYQDYEQADKRLNKAYKKTMLSLSISSQQSLREEQRAWLKRRDSKCKEEAKEIEGGSAWPLVFYGCLRQITVIRMSQIVTLSNKKSDLTHHSSGTPNVAP